MSTGTCTVHTWNDSATEDEGDPPMGMSYTNKLEYSHEFNMFRDTIRRHYSRNPREGIVEDDEYMFEDPGYGDW